MLVTPQLVSLTQVTVRLTASWMHLTLNRSGTPNKIILMFAGLNPQFLLCGSYIKSHSPFVVKEIKVIMYYLSLWLLCKELPFEILFIKGLQWMWYWGRKPKGSVYRSFIIACDAINSDQCKNTFRFVLWDHKCKRNKQTEKILGIVNERKRFIVLHSPMY